MNRKQILSDPITGANTTWLPCATMPLTVLPPADVAIVGAGIVGLAHAVTALNLGKSVVVIERDTSATGASVRNFGHTCFTAQPNELRDLAMSSRAGWLDAAQATGVPINRCGTLAVARTALELEVLEQAGAAQPDALSMLTTSEVHDHLGGLSPHVKGGAIMPLDMRVNPRTTVAHLAAWVDAHDNGRVLNGTTVACFDADASGVLVRTSRGSLRASQLFICVGHDLDYLAPDVAQAAQIERCRLNMTRVANPGATIAPAVLTSTSLTRYGAFAETSSAQALAAEVAERTPELVDIVANVMCTQLDDGSLLVGDTHHYDADAPPFMDEAHTDAVLRDMSGALGVERLQVIERWQGVYANSPLHDVFRVGLAPGVEAVTVTTGVGMTLSFGIARSTFGITAD